MSEPTADRTSPPDPRLSRPLPEEPAAEPSLPWVQRLLWWALVLVPAVAIADVAGLGAVGLFLLSALALIPLAFAIGEATEAAGEHTGPAIAGLLNASFGNAPELIISLFAIDRGLFEFVRGSLTGSVVSNLLLVLGATLVAGRSGELNRRSGFTSLAQTALATLLFLVPAVAHHWNHADRAFLPGATIPVVVVLLLLYLVLTVSGVRRQRREHVPGDVPIEGWTLRRSLGVLGLAGVATAFVSEVLTGSVEAFSKAVHLPDFFVAAVIVALVGNAAEHGGALVIASRGDLELASEIAFSSSAQVALFVIPTVVLVSIPLHALPLAFRPYELIALAVAVIGPGLAVAKGHVGRVMGWSLVATYAAVAAGFYAAA